MTGLSTLCYIEKDGKYYLYFCMTDDSEGVAVSDRPEDRLQIGPASVRRDRSGDLYR